MKLTDIRLEALNSAHQLDQLRETMHNMQVGLVLCGVGIMAQIAVCTLLWGPISKRLRCVFIKQ